MGTLLDWLHVRNGAASYSGTPLVPFLHVAWYVPIEFMGAGAFVGFVRPELDEELQRQASEISLWTTLYGLATLTFAWWASGALHSWKVPSAAIASILTLVGVGTWAIFDLTRQGAIGAAIAAAAGVIAESLIVKTGTYRYTAPDVLDLVPQWLPSLYVVACVAVGNMGRYMKYSWYPAPPVAASSQPAEAPRKAA